MNYIKKDEMKDFCIYFCNARNFHFGIWFNGKMHGIRHKWGDAYIDTENHYDDGEDNYGTCMPLLRLTDSLEKSHRIHPSYFDRGNWRGELILHDILLGFDCIAEDILTKLQNECKD